MIVLGKLRWLVAVLAVFGLLAAACSDDDEGGSTDDSAGDSTTDDSTAPVDAPEGSLVLGRILPESGDLAFLGAPMLAGVELAVEDINAAGGVNGVDVTLITGDEGDDAATVTESANRLLGEGMNALVGAAASGQSQEIIQTMSDEQIPQCSPANTAPDFTDQENADYYFRTVPPDQAVAPIIADRVIADGGQNIVITHRQDDYGDALAEFTQEALTEAGATVSGVVPYDPDASTFDTEISEISSFAPDTVVVVSFSEGGQIIRGLLEEGFTADQFYGGDGVYGPTFTQEVDPEDPSVINGMIVVGAAGTEEFNERLNEAMPPEEEGNVLYGGQAYDCAIVTALAAQAAGSIEGADILAEVVNVTTGGTVCTSYEECLTALEAGDDIDYDGPSGALDLSEPGDPTIANYSIGQFSDEGLVTVDSQVVNVADVT